ncbi:glycoside hydrolase family 16 protein [Zopfia rhizophila CBS 207.26]|uniref:Glycoside hydrolase family 16 protein n=1 Tax=Zopfia rhizophila CBS 207.26 TaxID=1314779 RepID=A0A6A6EDY3_9PEZI|nr:glycoside hydrolase family 16 protein [Zopfia rhizophila CBS 207.26]
MVILPIATLCWSLPVIRAAIPNIPGFTLAWGDDFIGGANTNWGTGEIQTYTSRPENIKLTGDGVLQITPVRDSAGQWTSARIETRRLDFQAAANGRMRISARIIIPDIRDEAAAGYWPAFWTLGGNYRGDYQNWPSVGEFDIMENVNGVNSVWGVLHCGVNPGGPCMETDGIAGNIACPGSPCQGNWHVYTIEVDRSTSPERLTWSVDGVTFHTVTQTQVGTDTWVQAVQHGHFILLNLAMGGAFPNNQRGSGTPIPATVPGVPLYVDWVAVYNSN